MKDIQCYPVDENFLAHSSAEGRLYLLNATGHLILEHLKACLTIGEIAADLSRCYGVAIETATADVEAAIREWHQIGLWPATETLPSSDQGLDAFSPALSNPINVTRYYELPGMRFSVRYDRDAMEMLCHSRFSAIETIGPSAVDTELEILWEGSQWVVTRDGRDLTRTVSPNEARVELLTAMLTSCYPALQIMAMIHAGVVAKENKAVLLPATTQGGKSTLTAALVHAGFRFLSDDTAAIDGPSGRVHPFPLGLSLRTGSWPIVERMFPELRDVPALCLPHETVKVMALPLARTVWEPLSVSAVIFPSYGSGRTNALHVLSLSRALVHLSDAGFWVQLQGGHVPRFLDWLRPIRCYHLEYSTIDAALQLIGELSL